jgi:hypothetical protein
MIACAGAKTARIASGFDQKITMPTWFDIIPDHVEPG